MMHTILYHCPIFRHKYDGPVEISLIRCSNNKKIVKHTELIFTVIEAIVKLTYMNECSKEDEGSAECVAEFAFVEKISLKYK